MSDLINRLRDYANQRKGELADLVNEAADALEKMQLSGESTTSDLISRQAAINTVQTMYERCDTGDITDYRDLMYESIIVLPSVQERKGRWIGKDSDSEMYDSYWCDQCHHEITVDAKRFCDIGFVIEDFKFCPNCGANMRGEQDDND